jgi:hypothetical protein
MQLRRQFSERNKGLHALPMADAGLAALAPHRERPSACDGLSSFAGTITPAHL